MIKPTKKDSSSEGTTAATQVNVFAETGEEEARALMAEDSYAQVCERLSKAEALLVTQQKQIEHLCGRQGINPETL